MSYAGPTVVAVARRPREVIGSSPRRLGMQEGGGGDDGILWITGGGEVVTFHKQYQLAP